MNPYESPIAVSNSDRRTPVGARHVGALFCFAAASGCSIWLGLFAAELRAHQFLHPQGLAALAVLGFPVAGFTSLAIGLWFRFKPCVLVGTIAVVPSVVVFAFALLMQSM